MVVLFDTGSFDAWILSTMSETSLNGVNHAFNPFESSTFEPTGVRGGVMFGSGFVLGEFGYDDVRVG